MSTEPKINFTSPPLPSSLSLFLLPKGLTSLGNTPTTTTTCYNSTPDRQKVKERWSEQKLNSDICMYVYTSIDRQNGQSAAVLTCGQWSVWGAPGGYSGKTIIFLENWFGSIFQLNWPWQEWQTNNSEKSAMLKLNRRGGEVCGRATPRWKQAQQWHATNRASQSMFLTTLH